MKSIFDSFQTMAESMPKKPRTSEDFQLFCKIVLEHANYDASDNDVSRKFNFV